MNLMLVKKVALLLMSLGMLAMPGLVCATTFIEQPFQDTVKEAPIIVRGKVGMIYTNWAVGEDGTRRIYTYNELLIDEVLKGSGIKGNSLIMRQMGGEKDGVGLQISGTAQFEQGEEVIVFLDEVNSDGSYDVQGMMMGKLGIVRSDDGQERLVGPAIESGNPETHPGLLHDGHDEKEGGHDGTSSSVRWTLDGLRKLVREQGGSPKVDPSPEKNKTFQDVIKGAPTPASVTSPSQSPAPQLQPAVEEAVFRFPWQYFLLGAAGAGLVAFFALRKRR